MDIFKIIGITGLIIISIGILTKKRLTQDILYILGGICMEAYSIYLKDIIFIILQFLFILAAAFDLIKIRFKKNSSSGHL